MEGVKYETMSANLKRMSLEEAINHANVKAEDQEREARVVTSEVLRVSHLQCASDHRQLAAWLTELKNRREKESSGDTISRQDAIDLVANYIWHYPNERYKDLNVFENAEALAKEALSSILSEDRPTGDDLFCKSQLITCNRVKECNGVCPFEDALLKSDNGGVG